MSPKKSQHSESSGVHSKYSTVQLRNRDWLHFGEVWLNNFDDFSSQVLKLNNYTSLKVLEVVVIQLVRRFTKCQLEATVSYNAIKIDIGFIFTAGR